MENTDNKTDNQQDLVEQINQPQSLQNLPINNQDQIDNINQFDNKVVEVDDINHQRLDTQISNGEINRNDSQNILSNDLISIKNSSRPPLVSRIQVVENRSPTKIQISYQNQNRIPALILKQSPSIVKQVVTSRSPTVNYQQVQQVPQIIHTRIQQQNLNLDKIQDLENYIQTLIAELDMANAKLRENFPHQQEVNNENSLIVNTLQEENKRLNTILKEKITENHILTNERDRFKLEIQHLEYFEVEYKKYQELIVLKQNEIDELRHKCTILDIQGQQLTDQNGNLTQSVEELKKMLSNKDITQNENLKRQNNFYQNQIEYLQSEQIEIKKTLSQRGEEINKWKNRFIESDSHIIDYQVTIKRNEDLIQSQQKEIQKLQNLLNQKNDELDTSRSQLIEINKLNNLLDQSNAEISRLQQQLFQKNDELLQLSEIYNQLVNDFHNLQKQLQDLQNINDDYQKKQQKNEEEIGETVKRHGRKHEELKQQFNLQITFRSSIKEKEDLVEQIKFRDTAIEELRRLLDESNEELNINQRKNLELVDLSRISTQKDSEYQQISQSYQQIQEEYQVQKEKMKQYARDLQVLEDVKNNLEHQTQDLEGKINNYLIQLEKKGKQIIDSNSQLDYQQVTIQNLSDQVEKLQAEIEKLNNIINLKVAENLQQSQRISELESLYQQIQSHEQEIVKLQELNNLKISEVSETRNKLTSSELSNSQLQQDRSFISIQLKQALSDIERLNNLLKDKNKQILTLESNISTFQLEQEQVKSSLTQIIQENDTKLKVQQNKLDQNNQKLKTYQLEQDSLIVKIQQLENKIKELENQLKDSDNLNKNLSQQISQLQQQLFNLNGSLQTLGAEEQAKIKKLIAQIEMQNIELSSKDIEISDLKSQLSQLQDQLNASQNDLRQRDNIIKLLNSQIQSSEQKLTNLQIEQKDYIENNENIISQLNQKIEQLILQKKQAEKSNLELSQEINTYQGKLKDQEYQIELLNGKLDQQIQLKNKIVIENSEFKQENEQLQIRIQDLLQQIEQLSKVNQLQLKQNNELNKKYNDQVQLIESLQTQIIGYERSLEELADQLGIAHQECDQMMNNKDLEIQQLLLQISQKDSLILSLQTQIQSLTNSLEELQKLQARIQILEQEKSEFDSKLSLTIESHQIQLNQKEVDISALLAQIEDLKKEVESLNDDISDLQNTREFLNSEVERLMQENTDQSQELSTWRNKYAVFSQLTEKLQDNLQLFVITFALIDSQNARLSQKETEIGDLRKSALQKYKK